MLNGISVIQLHSDFRKEIILLPSDAISTNAVQLYIAFTQDNIRGDFQLILSSQKGYLIFFNLNPSVTFSGSTSSPVSKQRCRCPSPGTLVTRYGYSLEIQFVENVTSIDHWKPKPCTDSHSADRCYLPLHSNTPLVFVQRLSLV